MCALLKNKAWVWSATQSKQIFCMRKTRRLIAICSNYYYLMLLYSLRITQARRATAFRDGEFIRLLTIASDHDSTYGKK